MAVKLSPVFNDAQLDSNGDPYVGAQLFVYAAGSTTKQTAYKDSGGLAQHANPITLNSRGEPPAPIWLSDGLTYKFVLATPTDTDPPAGAVRTVDNISGVNDATASTPSEWLASGDTPTYISATSFSVSGDKTSTYHANRRIKSTNSGGTAYSTISSSSFGSGITTVTVVNDGNTLDSGLSAVSLGMISGSDTSLPALQAKGDLLSMSASGTLSRIAAGTDGYSLRPVSGATSGLAYLPPQLGQVVNGQFTWTHNSPSANQLKIALKTWAGNDPSDSDPVFYTVRDATLTAGLPVTRKITAALSLTVNDTALLGTANSIAFRLWGLLVDDGGTPRIGVVKCLDDGTTGAASIMPLQAHNVISSTAMSTGADSAQVIYTDSGVTSKAFAIAGFAEWNAGLVTAGNWASAPTKVQTWFPGVPRPGDTVQCKPAYNATGSATSSTSLVDVTNSSLAITPTSECNPVRVDFTWAFNRQIIAATNYSAHHSVLRGSTDLTTADRLPDSNDSSGGGVQGVGVKAFTYIDTPRSTSSTTYKLQHRVTNGSGSMTTGSISRILTELMA